MSSALEFQRRKKGKSGVGPAGQPLPGILTNVAALLSQVQALEIQTTEEAGQAIFVLNSRTIAFVRLSERPIWTSPSERHCWRSLRRSICLLKPRAERQRIYFRGNDLEVGTADDGKQSKGTPCPV